MTTVRETSLQAYREIEQKGLLSLRRRQVYQVLFEFGPLIGSEVARLVKERFGVWGHSETIRNRLTELRDLGVVKECGKAIDPKNSRLVILWDVTKNVPVQQAKVKHKCPYCHGKGYTYKSLFVYDNNGQGAFNLEREMINEDYDVSNGQTDFR